MYLTMIIKTLFLYFFIMLAYRLMGKKEVGELSIIDLIVTFLIAEMAALAIEEVNDSILMSIIPIITLVLIQIILSYLTMKLPKLRDFIDGKPSIIIKKGKIVFSEMTKLRYTLDDLLGQLRGQGVKSIEDVDYAVLENNGQLSVFQNTKDYPMPLIMDGIIDYQILKEIGKDSKWLKNLIKENSLNIEDIFYAFYRQNKTYIVKKKDLL